MLLRLAAPDRMILLRGFMVLALIIVMGVVAAENQLNDLTQREDFAQVFNIRRDEAAGLYTAYVLGDGYRLKALYTVAGVSNTEQALNLDIAGRRYTLPTVVYFDLSRVEFWLTLWGRQFVEEAFHTKLVLAKHLDSIRPLLRDIIDSIKR